MQKNKNRKFWFLVALLVFGGGVINWFEQTGEANVDRRPLADFPVNLGEWRQTGNAIRFGEATESILRTTDYTMRDYFLPNGRLANVYIGYYSSQRSGATYHSPQNCLPGAGWVMTRPEMVRITTASGHSFEANRFIIENGTYKEVMIYWYQGRGRAVASEYFDKIYTVYDSITRRRSDGSMIRIMTNAGDSENAATDEAVKLSALVADKLNEFIPE